LQQVFFKSAWHLKLELAYGRSVVSLSLPSFAVVPEFREPEFAVDRGMFMRDLLLCLPEEKDKYRNVAIVVSDKTRLCGYPEYLPWLIGALINRGATKKNTTIYIAYGTHPHQTEEESLNAYGPMYKEFHFVHHDCRDKTLFEDLGITRRGTRIMMRKDILKCTLLLTFGAISHHYFAGYGGGRKLLFPGLGAREAIYHNHSLFLDPNTRSLSAGCQPGNLGGNPLAEDLHEIENRMPPRISIHGILNASGKVCLLFSGKNYSDYLSACHVHDGFYRLNSPQQYDLVVASSGGYPKDINFIQAHKSVHHASAFVKDGGTLVMLSECADGIGSDYFLQYLRSGSFEAAFTMLESNYEGNGGTALSLMNKTRRISIRMLTSLSDDECKTLGIRKVTLSDLSALPGEARGTLAVIKNASMLVK
jgi:nickel-dependent lactate racemase